MLSGKSFFLVEKFRLNSGSEFSLNFSIEVNVYRTAIINNNQLTLSTQRDICRELGLVIENKTKSTVVNYDREIRADVNAEGPEAHQLDSFSRDIFNFFEKMS